MKPDICFKLSTTLAVDESGDPVLVYRGEYGDLTKTAPGSFIQSRHASISFGSIEAATTYAKSPNHTSDTVFHPRIIPAYLIITNPVINDKEDPFIDYSALESALGEERAKRIIIELQSHVLHTNNWEDNFQAEFGDFVEDLIEARPEDIRKLYLDAFPVFDDPLYVSWFIEAGYDGVIHGGTGATALEAEYKVFSEAQIIPTLDNVYELISEKAPALAI